MSHSTSIRFADGAVEVDGLRVEDPVVAAILSRHQPPEYQEMVTRMLAVGARGLASMGLGLDLADMDRQVRQTMMEVLEEGRRGVADTLEELTRAVAGQLDPERRASVVGRLLGNLESFKKGLSDLVDPARRDSHAAALLEEMAAMLGPDGPLDTRLRSALDPESDGSGLAAYLRRVEQRLDDLAAMLAENRGREKEADRGTAKGFRYEDELEESLRRWARPLGALVERTGASAGEVGTGMVGDFVVVMPGGIRIVVEAKNCQTISLNGAGGILAELRRAMDNRSCHGAVCLSRNRSFPAEVGPFGVYGDVVLAVDDLEGTMLAVAMTWAVQRASVDGSTVDSHVDVGVIADRVERIRSLATQLSSSRRALTDIVGSVEKVRGSLDSVRLDLLEAACDLGVALRPGDGGRVVEMIPATG
ncbi:MAG: hypothetical protein WB239_17675 [Acidimicrobiia bacterium]